jgi:Mor family transcriptional regulator
MSLYRRVARSALVSRTQIAVDIPDQFYVGMTIDQHHEDRARQLGEGVLKGVEGISGSDNVSRSHFNFHRPFALFMDGQDTWSQNPDLVKIQYDDVDQVLADDTEILSRILMNQTLEDTVRQILQKCVTVLISKSAGGRGSFYDPVGRFSQTINSIINVIDRIGVSSIDSFQDLYDWTTDAIDIFVQGDRVSKDYQGIPSDLDFRDLLEQTVRGLANQYEGEQEWVLRDEVLNVPQGATLRILVDERVTEENLARQWVEYGKPELSAYESPPDGMPRDLYMKMAKYATFVESVAWKQYAIDEYDLRRRYDVEIVESQR